MKETEFKKKSLEDMMSILENGYKVRLVVVKRDKFHLDTLKEWRKIIKLLK